MKHITTFKSIGFVLLCCCLMPLISQSQNNDNGNNDPQARRQTAITHYYFPHTWNNLTRAQFQERIRQMQSYGWLVSYQFDFTGYRAPVQPGTNEVSGERIRADERPPVVLPAHFVGPPAPSQTRRTPRTLPVQLFSIGTGNRIRFMAEGANPAGMVSLVIQTNHGGRTHTDLLTINLAQANHADNDPYQIGLFFGEFLYNQLNHHQATALSSRERALLVEQARRFSHWMRRQRNTRVLVPTGNFQAPRLRRSQPRAVPLIRHPQWEASNGSVEMNRFLSGVAAQYYTLASTQQQSVRNYRLTRRTMPLLNRQIRRGEMTLFDRLQETPIDRDGLESNNNGGRMADVKYQNTFKANKSYVYNFAGKVIASYPGSVSRENLKGLSAGIYFIQSAEGSLKKIHIKK